MILLLIIFIAVSISPAIAQPQAPITWGPVEVLYSDSSWPAAGVTAKGDTIVLHSIFYNPDLYADQPALRVSGDGGVTWSPWHVFTQDRSNWMYTAVTFTSQAVFCISYHNVAGDRAGLSWTTDLGYTWQPPCSILNVSALLVSQGDTIFCRSGLNNVTWTADGGCTYSQRIPTGLPAGTQSLAVGGGWIHVVTTCSEAGRGRVLYYTRAPLSTGIFEAPRDLLPDIYWTQNAHVECDEEGTVMVLAPINYHPPLPWLVAQMVSISRDFGATWAERDTLTPIESADYTDEEIVREGSHWFVVWVDSTASSGFADGGLRCKFSANRGRSWYPSLQIEGETEYVNGVSALDLRLPMIMVYSTANRYFFLRWCGAVAVDSLTPAISAAAELPGSVCGDTLLPVGMMATDNDSLWRAAFVARQTGAVDSTIISLTRDSIALYRGLWSVPPDTAVWACYYRAEDMWENVSYMPPEGPANPWIMHVGVMDAAREREMASTDFRFTLYPNPSNEDVTFVVNGVPSSGRIGIEVFDILGRRVAYVTSSSSVGGVVRLPWDTRSVSGVPLPSGMYYVHISSANRSAVGKFVVLK